MRTRTRTLLFASSISDSKKVSGKGEKEKDRGD